MSEPYFSMAKRAMLDRYQYMRALYTCLFEASKYGSTCFDPAFYYFNTEDPLFAQIEQHIIFAGAIMVNPSLTDEDFVDAYFPKGTWASLNNLGSIIEGGKSVILDATTSINAHLMPGKLVAFQNNSQGTYQRVQDLINASVSLIVNTDTNGYATGSLFLDQGSSKEEIESANYEYFNFIVSQKSI